LLVAYVVYWSIALTFARGRQIAAPVSRPSMPEAANRPFGSGVSIADPFTHGAMSERRRFVRRSGNPVPVVISDAAGRQPARSGAVLDRSQGGLRLLVDEPAKKGTIISVRAEAGGAGIPWARMEVRHCQRTNVGWEWGCRFLDNVPASLMLLFG
jgi:hypothetical protein